MYEIQWRQDNNSPWEPQVDVATRDQAHEYISEQPDGGQYRIVSPEAHFPVS